MATPQPPDSLVCPQCARTVAIGTAALQCAACGFELDGPELAALLALDDEARQRRARVEELTADLNSEQDALYGLMVRRLAIAAQPPPPRGPAVTAPDGVPPPPPPPPVPPTGLPAQGRDFSAAVDAYQQRRTRQEPERGLDWEPIGLRTWLLGIGVGLLLLAGLAFVTVTWPDLNDLQRFGVLATGTAIAATLTTLLRHRLPATADALCVLTLVLLLVDWGALRRAGVATALDVSYWWAIGQTVVALAAEPARRMGLRAPLVTMPLLLAGAGVAAALAVAEHPWQFGVLMAMLATGAVVASALVRSSTLELARRTTQAVAASAWGAALIAAWVDLGVQASNEAAFATARGEDLLRPAAVFLAAAVTPAVARAVVPGMRARGFAEATVATSGTLLLVALAHVVGDSHDSTAVWIAVAVAGIVAIVLAHVHPRVLGGLVLTGALGLAPAGLMAVGDGATAMVAPYDLGYDSFSGSMDSQVRDLATRAPLERLTPVAMPPDDARRSLLAVVVVVGLLLASVGRNDLDLGGRRLTRVVAAVMIAFGAASAAVTVGPVTVAAATMSSLLLATLATAVAGVLAVRSTMSEQAPRLIAMAAAVAAIPVVGWARLDPTWSWVILATLSALGVGIVLCLRRDADRQTAAVLAAVLAVAASWAALAPNWAGTDDALRAALVVSWVAVTAVGLARQRHPEGVALESVGLLGMLGWAASTVPDARLSAATLSLAAAVLTTAALLRDRGIQRAAAPLVVTSAVVGWLRVVEVDVIEAYTTVLALGILGAIAWGNRGVANLTSREAYSWPLWIGVSIPVLLAIVDPGQTRPVTMFAVCAALVALGVLRSLRAPLEVGCVGLLVLGIDALAPFATQLPRWVALSVSGSVVLWLGATVERRMTEVRAARERYAELR